MIFSKNFDTYFIYLFCHIENNDGKSFRRSSKSYDKKKETDEDDREDEELDWSHPVRNIFGEKTYLYSSNPQN